MPLPLLIGAAVLAAGWGAKKGIDAKKDFSKATEYNDRARKMFNEASTKLDNSRRETNESFEDLGRIKLKAYNKTITNWISLVEQIKHMDKSKIEVDGFRLPTESEFLELKEISLSMSEIAGVGTASLTTGVLAGLGAYGGATTFAAASTGAAISGLSGVAATNATLAWFGGGSLATGGLGMAGGTAVLGGIVAGPILLAAGMIAASKAEKARADAYSNLKGAEVEVENLNAATLMADNMKAFAKSLTKVLIALESNLAGILTKLASIVTSSTDFRTYSQHEQIQVHMSFLIAVSMKDLINLSIMTKDGSYNKSEFGKLGLLLSKYNSDISVLNNKIKSI